METMTEVPVQIPDDVRAEIQEDYRGLVQCVVQESKTSMARGWYAAAIERKGGWEIVGYKHQHSCRVALGVSYSNWYRTMAVAQNFSKLTKDVFLTMKLENAETLGREPEEIRYDAENIQRAATEPVSVFKARFTAAEPEEKEHWSTFELKMSRSKKEAIELGLRSFMAKHDIDNVSYALELLVAEFSQGPTITGFIHKSIPEITQQIREAGDLEDLRLITLEFLQKIGEVVGQCCGDEEELDAATE